MRDFYENENKKNQQNSDRVSTIVRRPRLSNAAEEMQKKLLSQEDENGRLKKLLENERIKVDRFQKKLQYIQDNQEMFTKLKEAYMNMKATETGMKRAKQDFCVQTPVSCDPRICVPSKCIQGDPDCCNGMCAVNKDELSDMLNMVKNLQNTVSENTERILKQPKIEMEKRKEYRQQIDELSEENKILKYKLQQATLDLEDTKQSTGIVDSKENCMLRKLCAKMANVLMDDTSSTTSKDSLETVLTAKESKLINALVYKYDRKSKHEKYSKSSRRTNFEIPTVEPKNPYRVRSVSVSAREAKNTPRANDEIRAHSAEHGKERPPPTKPQFLKTIVAESPARVFTKEFIICRTGARSPVSELESYRTAMSGMSTPTQDDSFKTARENDDI